MAPRKTSSAQAVSAGPFEGFPRQGVDWFRALAISQSREWFAANRRGYDNLWLRPMQALLGELKGPLSKLYGKPLRAPKIFRLNRDVRFSKDKSPYKTSIGGMLGFEGTDGPMGGPVAVYLQLGLENLAAAGFYALEPPALLRLRRGALDEKAGAALRKAVDAAQRQGLSLTSLQTLKRPPPGVPVDHPRADILRQKGLALTFAPIPASVRHSPKLKAWLLAQARAAKPVVDWGLKHKLAV